MEDGNHNDLHQTTLQAFLAQLQPKDWNRPELHWNGDFNNRWNLDRYFQWPPDLFAATSLLLENTGAYRATVMPGPDGKPWPPANWATDCRAAARTWREHLACSLQESEIRTPCRPPASEGEPSPDIVPELQGYYRIVCKHRSVCLNDLYDVGEPSGGRGSQELERDRNAHELICALLALHCIADETMCGIGTLFAPRIPRPDYKHGHDVPIELLHMQANLLLTMRGTLSRIGKHRGLVLPKLQTPSLGLTARSLSHYLSFHQAEVDVAWRAVPWPNLEENTLNLLIYPWPDEIQGGAFRTHHHTSHHHRGDNALYFSYAPPGHRFDARKVVDAVQRAMLDVRRVNFVVLPEAALTEANLIDLKRQLATLKPADVPVIVTGVADKSETSGTGGAEPMRYNKAVLAFHQTGKWYDIRQDKHHRWRLDPAQCASYQLPVSGARSAWEAIAIPRRRLSFLTSDAWLTMAPLICEDLARLDPVSSIVRGVGPCLILALLLDGPQIPERWSARYAAVFAEDPGSSVLSVTALGMSRRALPVPCEPAKARELRDANAACVALWKDRIGGARVLRVDDPMQPELLLTIAAQPHEEETVDMRATEGAGVLAFHTLRLLKQDDKAQAKECHEEKDPPESRDPERQHADVFELSLFTFYVDALVDSDDPGAVHKWMRWAVGEEDNSAVFGNGEEDDFAERLRRHNAGWEILRLIRWSLEHRKATPRTIPSPQLLIAIDRARELMPPRRQPLQQLRELFERVEQELTNQEKHRQAGTGLLVQWQNECVARANAVAARRDRTDETRRHGSPCPIWDVARVWTAVSHTVLASIHNRLLTARRAGESDRTSSQLLTRVERCLERDIWTRLVDWQGELREAAWRSPATGKPAPPRANDDVEGGAEA